MKTYYRHWVRESLLKPVTRNWRPTNPPQYEVVYYRGKWTVHFITEFCPILIAEEKTEELCGEISRHLAPSIFLASPTTGDDLVRGSGS
jgi:hypothetical protein